MKWQQWVETTGKICACVSTRDPYYGEPVEDYALAVVVWKDGQWDYAPQVIPDANLPNEMELIVLWLSLPDAPDEEMLEESQRAKEQAHTP